MPLPAIYNSAWGGSTPASGPHALEECLGFWFDLDVDCRLAGFTWFADATTPAFVLFQLWDTTPELVAQQVITGPDAARVPSGTGWRIVWNHPRTILQANTPYLVSASLSRWYATFGALVGADIVSGHVRVFQDMTSPNPRNGVYDSATDSTTRWSFLSPPANGTTGNWYAIDVLVEPV